MEEAKTIINVAGDYVQSKHVDYEINNVEAGGIGIQFVNGKQTTIKPSAPSTRKRDTSVPYTIRYMNANDQSRTQRLLLLMQSLQNLKWIEEPKSADDFIDLFDGKPRECNIKWTDTINQATIYYFLQQLLAQQHRKPVHRQQIRPHVHPL